MSQPKAGAESQQKLPAFKSSAPCRCICCSTCKQSSAPPAAPAPEQKITEADHFKEWLLQWYAMLEQFAIKPRIGVLRGKALSSIYSCSLTFLPAAQCANKAPNRQLHLHLCRNLRSCWLQMHLPKPLLNWVAKLESVLSSSFSKTRTAVQSFSPF
jgi:hypothetical protein